MRYLLSLAAGLLLLLTAAGPPLARDANPMTLKDVDGLIEKNLKIGDPKGAVLRFLSDQGIENSGHAQKQVVFAIVRDVAGNRVVKKSITVKFVFDEKGNLSRYSVDEAFTGP